MTFSDSKERTRNYFRQISGAFVYKVAAMGASFLAIPIMIRYLGEEQFGVWSTLLAVLSWMVFFDLGIGNGLRNKVAELNAKGELDEAAAYIGSAYVLLGLVAFSLWIIFSISAYWIPWEIVFNTSSISEVSLRETILITVFFISINFWLGLITALLGAIQKTSLIALGQLISNVFVLALIFLLSRFLEVSISNLAIVYGISIVLANITLNLWFFYTEKKLRPHLYLDKKHISPLLSIGIQFFIIQFAVLIIFTTDKILITQLFGPEYVAQYEVVFKLFSVISFGYALISAPLWSAYTDAFHRSDMYWIRRMFRLQAIIFFGIMLIVGLLAMVAPFIIKIWISDDFVVSSDLIIAMSIFVIISIWNNIYSMFLNGIGKIKIQLYTAIFAMTINVPLSIFLSKTTELGTSSIVWGTSCSLVIAAVVLPTQVYYILNPIKKVMNANS